MKLIIGKLNNNNGLYYWKIEEDVITKFNLEKDKYFKNLVGNYAIVENMSDFDLVKIVGVVETIPEYEKVLNSKTINKKVVNIVGSEMLRPTLRTTSITINTSGITTRATEPYVYTTGVSEND